MHPSTLIPIVPCSGSGTRLWPQSRVSHPKRFLDRAGRVVTLGIRPTRPATGLGSVESGDEVLATTDPEADGAAAAEPPRALVARGFREKLDRATAERFLATGGFWWIAGMFVFTVATMAERFERHMPGLWERVRTVEPDRSNLDEVYAGIEPESLEMPLGSYFGEDDIVRYEDDFDRVPRDGGE